MQSVLDHSTWIMNLTAANANPSKDPVWFELYRAKNEYALVDMNPHQMSNLFQRLVDDDDFLRRYYKQVSVLQIDRAAVNGVFDDAGTFIKRRMSCCTPIATSSASVTCCAASSRPISGTRVIALISTDVWPEGTENFKRKQIKDIFLKIADYFASVSAHWCRR